MSPLNHSFSALTACVGGRQVPAIFHTGSENGPPGVYVLATGIPLSAAPWRRSATIGAVRKTPASATQLCTCIGCHVVFAIGCDLAFRINANPSWTYPSSCGSCRIKRRSAYSYLTAQAAPTEDAPPNSEPPSAAAPYDGAPIEPSTFLPPPSSSLLAGTASAAHTPLNSDPPFLAASDEAQQQLEKARWWPR
jgi:hypothetical protein